METAHCSSRKRLTKKALLLLRLSPKSSFTSSKLTHRCGFSSSLLGIECKHSLLSHAASVAVFGAFASLKIALFIQPLNKTVVKKGSFVVTLAFCNFIDYIILLLIYMLTLNSKFRVSVISTVVEISQLSF